MFNWLFGKKNDSNDSNSKEHKKSEATKRTDAMFETVKRVGRIKDEDKGDK